MRLCNQCWTPKDEGEFYWRNEARGLRRKECKKCTGKRSADWSSTHKDQARARQNRWNKENPERKKSHGRTARLVLKGLSQVSYDALLESQGGTCALCSETRDLCVDHDHRCCPGKRSCGRCVRGILCRKHNAGLGHFSDDVKGLARAIQYLSSV
jgi:hypothetical protein